MLACTPEWQISCRRPPGIVQQPGPYWRTGTARKWPSQWGPAARSAAPLAGTPPAAGQPPLLRCPQHQPPCMAVCMGMGVEQVGQKSRVV